MRSAEHSASADLWRYQCGPTLTPQGPPTHKDRRAPVRGPHPTLSPRWRRPDDHRGHRRRHRRGHPQRDRHGHAPMAACDTLLPLAGAVSPAQDRGGHSAVAAGAPRCASRHRRPTPCGPQCAPLTACLRGLLPAEESASRHPHSHHRYGPQAGLGGSRACGNTAALTSHRASMPPQRRTASARSPAWPRRPRHWARRWGPSRRRENDRPSSHADPPITPPRPCNATCRQGCGAGLCPKPYDHQSHPSTVVLQR
jgi:hypothetical protein